jgi:hypothetical protein
MTVEDAKLLVQAFTETNALIRKAIRDTERIVAFSQTDEYWEEVVKKYEILKFNKTKL